MKIFNNTPLALDFSQTIMTSFAVAIILLFIASAIVLVKIAKEYNKAYKGLETKESPYPKE